MWQRVEHPSGLVAYRSSALTALGVPHLATTRLGPFGRPLDLTEPDSATLEALRSAAGADPRARLLSLCQVHGSKVVEVAEHGEDLPGPAAGAATVPAAPAGDALVSGSPHHLLMVYSADCVPVLVASADGRRVAAIHAGWRGLMAGVIPAALARLGAAAAAAAIGPCLSLEHCEMGPEVVEQFIAAGLEAAVHTSFGARAHIDVRTAARIQLERAGCPIIDVSDRCTWRDHAEFPSHRRDVTHGTQTRAGRIGVLIAARR